MTINPLAEEIIKAYFYGMTELKHVYNVLLDYKILIINGNGTALKVEIGGVYYKASISKNLVCLEEV